MCTALRAAQPNSAGLARHAMRSAAHLASDAALLPPSVIAAGRVPMARAVLRLLLLLRLLCQQLRRLLLQELQLLQRVGRPAGGRGRRRRMLPAGTGKHSLCRQVLRREDERQSSAGV